MSERGLIFEEPPDDLDASWRQYGSLLGGMASCPDNRWLARAYRQYADSLIGRSAKDFGDWEIHPILFLYRHALETRPGLAREGKGALRA